MAKLYDVIAIDGDDLFIIGQNESGIVIVDNTRNMKTKSNSAKLRTSTEVYQAIEIGLPSGYDYYVLNCSSGERIVDLEPHPSPTMDEDYFVAVEISYGNAPIIALCSSMGYIYGSYSYALRQLQLQNGWGGNLANHPYKIFKLSDGYRI